MTKKEAAADAQAAMVDELGALEAELAPLKPKLARVDVLRAALRSCFLTDAAETFTVAGQHYIATLGPRGNESLIDIAALYKLAGPKVFVEIANVSQKAIVEKCGAATLGAVVSIRQTGPRPLTVVKAQ